MTPAPALGHRPGLDGVRAVAIALVLVHHLRFPAWHITGFVGDAGIGVDVFFVLSGFLITRLLLDEVDGTGTISLGHFWARRALRLLPLAVVVIAIVWASERIAPGSFAAEHLDAVGADRSALAALTYHMNWLQAFPGTHHVWALTHTWSLSIEEQFYVLWPPLVLVAVRRRSADAAGAVTRLALVVVVASSAVRLWLALRGSADHVYNGLDSRAGQLAAGAALAGASLRWPRAVATIGRRGALGFAALAVIASRPWVNSDLRGLRLDLLAAIGVACVAAGIRTDDGPLPRALRHPAARWLGVRSYALYLVHYPVILAMSTDRLGWGPNAVMAARLVVSLALAELAHRCVERPFQALRSRYAVFRPRVGTSSGDVAAPVAVNTTGGPGRVL